MTSIEIYSEGTALVVKLALIQGESVQSLTSWWRYFWRENTTRAIADNLPHACIEIKSLRIV